MIDHLEAAGFRLAGLEPEFFDPDTAVLQVQGIFVREQPRLSPSYERAPVESARA